MTQAIAEYLAAALSIPHSHDDYRARKLHGQWLVWCDASDHAVEIDQGMVNAARAAIRKIEAAEQAHHDFERSRNRDSF